MKPRNRVAKSLVTYAQEYLRAHSLRETARLNCQRAGFPDAGPEREAHDRAVHERRLAYGRFHQALVQSAPEGSLVLLLAKLLVCGALTDEDVRLAGAVAEQELVR